MQKLKPLLIGSVLVLLTVLAYNQILENFKVSMITNHPLYLKLTSDNEYGIRTEDLKAIQDSSYSDKTKKLLIKIAQDVRNITANHENESWVVENANQISLHLACGVLAEMAENNNVIQVFKVFVNDSERMSANQNFWMTYDKTHGSKPYPSKEECDQLVL